MSQAFAAETIDSVAARPLRFGNENFAGKYESDARIHLAKTRIH